MCVCERDREKLRAHEGGMEGGRERERERDTHREREIGRDSTLIAERERETGH